MYSVVFSLLEQINLWERSYIDNIDTPAQRSAMSRALGHFTQE